MKEVRYMHTLYNHVILLYYYNKNPVWLLARRQDNHLQLYISLQIIAFPWGLIQQVDVSYNKIFSILNNFKCH